jgi:DNA polymerase IV (archaeal DinB-like DNA polymerase)
LKDILGKVRENGSLVETAAHGLDFSEIEKSEEAVKSISRSSTFKEDSNDPIKIAGYLEMLAESVHKSLVKHQFSYKVVSIRVRYDDFATYTRSKTVPVWTSDIIVIKRTAMQLLSEFIGRQKHRLVGVGVSRLRKRDVRQTLITDL